jgi:hypothetical protein
MANAINCPIPSDPKWKELIKKLGSKKEAYKAFIANGFKIPSDKELNLEDKQKRDVEEKKSKRFSPIIERNELEIKRLKSIVSRKQSDLGKVKNKYEQRKRIQALKNKIEELEETNVMLKKKKALNDVETYAEEDLGNVESILNRYYSEGITFSELHSVIKTIKMWQQAGDFSQEDHLFLTSEEMEELDNPDNELIQEIRKKFLDWKSRSDRLYNKYIQISTSLLNDAAQEEFGEDAYIELDKALKDVNFLFKNTIDISEVDSVLFQLLSQWNKKANHNARQEVKEDVEDIKSIMNRLRKKGVMNKFINLLQQRQSNSDERKTGDITFRFTQKWFNDEKKIYKRLQNKLNKADNIEDRVKASALKQKAYQEFRDSINKTTFTLDMRKLFYDDELIQNYLKTASLEDQFKDINLEFNEKTRQDHIREIKRHLGEEGFERYYERAKEKLETFKKDMEAQRESLEADFGENQAAVEENMQIWNLKYNPFWNSHYAHEGHPAKKIGNTWVSSSKQYIEVIARRFDENGKDLGNYDKNFELIAQDEDMYEAYNLILDVLNTYSSFLPSSDVGFFQVNTLPTIRKSVLESFTRDGMLSGLNSTWDLLKNNTRAEAAESRIPETDEKELQVNFLANTQSTISDYVDRKTIEYKNKNPEYDRTELAALQEEWVKEVEDKLASAKSWDIEKILIAFSTAASQYKHKAKIEDAMKITRNMIDELIEAQDNAEQNPTYSKMSERLGWKRKDLKNMKDMVDHFMDNFFGYPIKNNKGKTKKKVYTKKEKKEKEELQQAIQDNLKNFEEGIITEDTFIKNDDKLQTQLEKLGGVRSWTRIGDLLLKYIQLKGLGWNVFSGFANIGFGQIANWVEAAGGQRFNQKELRKASWLVRHSIGKNGSFHLLETSTSKKIRNLMDKLDVLKESKNELFEQKVNSFMKKFRFANPFNMQSRGEYLNQAPVMIAMMMHEKVLLNGKETNMWEAIGEDGNFKEGVTLPENSNYKSLDDLLFKRKSSIDDAIRELHGNYDYEDAPLLVKRTWAGRAISQFRTWAFMGFYNRFGGEHNSHIAGYTKKGRYRSLATYYQNLGGFKATVDITKNLLRKVMFQNTKFNEMINSEEGFTETDAANMRKNMQEIVLYMIVTGLGLLLKSAVEDNDDERSKLRYASIFWINQMGRLKTDILFYTNPMEFEKLQRQVMPAFTFVMDASKLMDHGYKLLTGQTTDIYQSGIYAHKSKSKRYARNLIPGWNIINKLESAGKQIYQGN